MKILVDICGADLGEGEAIKGAIEGVKHIKGEVILVGDINKVKDYIKANYDKDNIEEINTRLSVIDAKDAITNHDEPAFAIKNKKESSLVKAFDYMKTEENSAIISAGSTGALMAGALLKMGRLPGVHRPALSTILPTKDKKGVMMLDCGANPSAKDVSILQYAMLGKIYMENVLDRKNIKIALLNIGTEEKKGTPDLQEVYKLLKDNVPEFIGNLEARDVCSGIADVVVCNGIMGNVALKAFEGTASLVKHELKDTLNKNLINKIKALVIKGMLKEILKKFDYTEYGGAVLLGVKKTVLKIHGSSKAKSYTGAIIQAEKMYETGINEKIQNNIYKYNEIKTKKISNSIDK